MVVKTAWTLIDKDGTSFSHDTPGSLGGHRRTKLYGLLDCRAARQAIARGGYVKHRVFFLNELTAVSAGYRPCAVCLPEKYQLWKATQPTQSCGARIDHDDFKFAVRG